MTSSNSGNTLPEGWANDVLEFWFSELEKSQWFKSSKELDEQIVSRFGVLHGALASLLGESEDSTDEMDSPDSALAAVLVLDQFSRNMYRAKADAFAFDAQALQVSKHAIDAGFNASMTTEQKQFLYMPFMHSENSADQQRSVELFASIDQSEYAVDHCEVVTRFGRFPHRNDVLGRNSTDAEIEYLKDAKRYGQ